MMDIEEFEPWQNTLIKIETIKCLAREYDLYNLLNYYLDIVIKHLTYHANRKVSITFEEFEEKKGE